MEKHTIRVGKPAESSTVGETIAFTADCLGTVHANFDDADVTVDYTFYRLSDGTFRVLVGFGGLAILYPSNMEQAIQNGQRNNYSYGRMTEEEIKREDKFQIGEVYERLMAQHPETVRNRVRDLD